MQTEPTTTPAPVAVPDVVPNSRCSNSTDPHEDALAAAESELVGAHRGAEDARTELRVLRNEEARATMLEDELRAAKAELESLRASHRADLVESEAELEEKVRATREEFQRQVDEIEESYKGQMDQRESGSAPGIRAGGERPPRRRRVTSKCCGTSSRRLASEAGDRERRLLEAHERALHQERPRRHISRGEGAHRRGRSSTQGSRRHAPLARPRCRRIWRHRRTIESCAVELEAERHGNDEPRTSR